MWETFCLKIWVVQYSSIPQRKNVALIYLILLFKSFILSFSDSTQFYLLFFFLTLAQFSDLKIHTIVFSNKDSNTTLQAYYRRASANMALGKFKLALRDFEAVSVCLTTTYNSPLNIVYPHFLLWSYGCKNNERFAVQNNKYIFCAQVIHLIVHIKICETLGENILCKCAIILT